MATPTSDPPPSFPGFQFDLYDDMSRLHQQIHIANKPDELKPLLDPCTRVVNLVHRDDAEFIRFDLLVDNESLIALVDTGSTITCISSRALPKLQVQVIPADENDASIQLAHADTFIPRIGITAPLLLDTGSSSASHHVK
ncbi:hypothetical protein BGZ65_001997 [Modicella reniformis]|uniref:Uncharacterized protein n=1 Tax=Modicella reniformis TaxID=1440133 RepID=A0A9P6J1D4_9FUNG|nr:hypothetical protein BGZ65_001997 [Modicella reniformis]